MRIRQKILSCGLLALLGLSLTGCTHRAPKGHQIEINGHVWPVELAETPQQQSQGLSDRPGLASSTGMLFVFTEPAEQTFWMKDMQFPLDIIWIKDRKIVKLDVNLPPAGPSPSVFYRSETLVDHVLEINALEANEFNIKIGDQVNYD